MEILSTTSRACCAPARTAMTPDRTGSLCERGLDAPAMACIIALTQDWTVRVDPWWYPLLRGYRWQARPAARGGGGMPDGASGPQGGLCVWRWRG